MRTIGSSDVPDLARHLGVLLEEDLLEVLEQRYAGRRSYELEVVIRESGIQTTLHVF